jgi:molybdenum cofactor guanylyltransferase
MGGSKLVVALQGRPLIDYPLQALKAALPEVAVIAKPDVVLPAMSGVMLWIEPEEPQHPLLGVVEALALAGGRPVLICPADLPFVTPELILRLVEARPEGAPAVIASCEGNTQPLLGCFQPEAADLLADAAYDGEVPVRQAVAAIRPKLLEVLDPNELFNVNSPDDLLQAAAILGQKVPRAPRAGR